MEMTFALAVDPTGELGNVMVPQMKGGQVTVTAAEVHVQLGAPPVFDMVLPRSAIARVERAPDLKRLTRGVHGWRGRWLVNQAGTGLVKLTLNARFPAAMNAKPESVPGLASAGKVASMIARLVLRERTLKVEELTLSLEDPAGFLVALGSAPDRVGTNDEDGGAR